jgi:cyclopropane fatty-acyl-phospholipid synthase-like methyltransferase
MKQKDFYFNSYAKFAKKITKNNSHILSARYKFLTSKYKYICEDICEKLSINKSDDIFDIGTGDGKIINYLSKKCKSATTIDSEEVINRTNHNKKVIYLKGNIHKEGKKIKKRFDKILVYSVVQYFRNVKEVITFINLCSKLLKDVGMILIGDIPNQDMDLRYQNTKNYKKQSKIFDEKRKLYITKLEKDFFSNNKVKTIQFSDKILFSLIKKFNTSNYESYILPQKKDLPYSVKRVDLLIRKRS